MTTITAPRAEPLRRFGPAATPASWGPRLFTGFDPADRVGKGFHHD